MPIRARAWTVSPAPGTLKGLSRWLAESVAKAQVKLRKIDPIVFYFLTEQLCPSPN